MIIGAMEWSSSGAAPILTTDPFDGTPGRGWVVKSSVPGVQTCLVEFGSMTNSKKNTFLASNPTCVDTNNPSVITEQDAEDAAAWLEARGMGGVEFASAMVDIRAATTTEELRIAIAAAYGSVESPGDELWVEPNGSGSGNSILSPSSLSTILSRSDLIGKTIWLKDGTYTGLNNTIYLPSYVSGTEENPILIKAINPGSVLIDGQGTNIPVVLSGNKWVTIYGINACRSSNSVISISSCEDVTVSSCVAWDAADDGGNNTVYSISSSIRVKVSGCAGFGIGRKIFSVSSSSYYCTIEDCWGRWEGYSWGPNMTYTLGYKSYNLTIQRCIGTWSLERTERPSDYEEYGIFASDNYFNIPFENRVLNNNYEKCLAYVKDSDVFTAVIALFHISWSGGVQNVTASDLTAICEYLDIEDKPQYGGFLISGITNQSFDNLKVACPRTNGSSGGSPTNTAYASSVSDLNTLLAARNPSETVVPSWLVNPHPLRDRVYAAYETAIDQGAPYDAPIDIDADLDEVLYR